MQALALDKDEKQINAKKAVKGKNYLCLACGGKVRRRGGDYVRDHFYHLHENRSCHLSQKSETHLHLQLLIEDLLPPGEALLEERFQSIGRIADVAWPRYKIVFEVQYSPITVLELGSRIEDYQSIGWTVVWILHTHTFYKERRSREELFLDSFPHYYANHSPKGEGFFFDVVWDSPFPSALLSGVEIRSPFLKPKELAWRDTWPFYFKGDFIEKSLQGSFDYPKPILQQRLSIKGLLQSAYQQLLEAAFRNEH